jgi:hypothetical protein
MREYSAIRNQRGGQAKASDTDTRPSVHVSDSAVLSSADAVDDPPAGHLSIATVFLNRPEVGTKWQRNISL